jgi:hypothetical protein
MALQCTGDGEHSFDELRPRQRFREYFAVREKAEAARRPVTHPRQEDVNNRVRAANSTIGDRHLG